MAKAKRIKGINCKSSASQGIKLVLLTRFEELSGFQEAALNWTDPEGVHSMRVASRRLRSALRDFMPYVRKRALASVLKQLRRIADSLGEVRDQDVAIMALEKMVTHAPADFGVDQLLAVGVYGEILACIPGRAGCQQQTKRDDGQRPAAAKGDNAFDDHHARVRAFLGRC